jgi:hypothetical protein
MVQAFIAPKIGQAKSRDRGPLVDEAVPSGKIDQAERSLNR